MLGGLFRGLFGKKNNDSNNVSSNRNGSNTILDSYAENLEVDDIINLSDQMGLFENIGLDDEELINRLCEEIVNAFNASDKKADTLVNIVESILKENDFIPSLETLNLFKDCFVECYLMEK